jgi:DNA replication protein DnaC
MQIQNESVNTTVWGKFLDFEIGGDGETRRQLALMLSAAAIFLRAVKAGKNPFWLTLLGSSGAGKTYLARKIWRWYRSSTLFRSRMDEDTGDIIFPGSWINWPSIAGELLGNEGYGILSDLQNEKLIVLDEIGADRDPSGHTRDCLARLLSARVGKWTIITSNKTLGDIQRDIDARISSRIIRDGSLVVDVDVPDFHLRR